MGRAKSALLAAPKLMDCLMNLRRVLSFIVASCKLDDFTNQNPERPCNFPTLTMPGVSE
jgi:hypothetical protein